MLSETWPPVMLLLLRQALFLGPLLTTLVLMLRHRDDARMLIGALFSFLYGLPLLFIDHVLAIQFGFWHYGGETLKVLQFPTDIWFAGALMGPVVYLALPQAPPWLLATGLVALDGLFLPSLAPFVIVGQQWFPGVILVFVTTHLPALYLARWTDRDVYLPRRAALLAVAFAGLAFFLIPTMIMHATSGSWAVLATRPIWALVGACLALLLIAALGLTGVQMFVLYGEGTPIPLDPTKRLVRQGIYAYVCNPMQLSAVLGFALLGLILGNHWVGLAAAMALVFVLGMVRWHQRNDLAVRFPAGWPNYRAHVAEWLPRWRPWIPGAAMLRYDPSVLWQRCAVAGLRASDCVRLEITTASGQLTYADARQFRGIAALAQAMSHCNFVAALAGGAALLLLLPLHYLRSTARGENHG
jgi:protein-S-isoprenylcysteine O-methyltransferase Ste14